MLKALAATNKEVILIDPYASKSNYTKNHNDFLHVYPNIKHVIYDTISSDAALMLFENIMVTEVG